MDFKTKSLKLHEMLRGKVEVQARTVIKSREDLSLVYSPGVAEPCLEIQKHPHLSFVYTRRHNTIAVVSDGSAVLGLGNIGPEASMPVMEGKALLFKQLGGVDAIPLCLKTQNVDEIVNIIYALSGSFGGINLEDISAPRCFEIEARLKALCDIPIFHDDQHGTSTVVLAALINALKIVNKSVSDIRVVINGIGAAGSAIAEILLDYGVQDLLLCDRDGLLAREDNSLSQAHQRLAKKTNSRNQSGSLSDALKDADVFIGVSAPDCVTLEDIQQMRKDPIVFPLANPRPEISYEKAQEAGAKVIGTGLSNHPNQVNNLLAFPGIFRGALDAKAKDITRSMMIAAAEAIAACVAPDHLTANIIIPSPLDPIVHHRVASAVKKIVDQQNASTNTV